VKRNFPKFICSSRLFLTGASEISVLFQKGSKSSTSFAEQILFTLNHTQTPGARGVIFGHRARGTLILALFGGPFRSRTYLNKWLINQAGYKNTMVDCFQPNSFQTGMR
jgi:hypothetical protein